MSWQLIARGLPEDHKVKKEIMSVNYFHFSYRALIVKIVLRVLCRSMDPHCTHVENHLCRMIRLSTVSPAMFPTSNSDFPVPM